MMAAGRPLPGELLSIPPTTEALLDSARKAELLEAGVFEDLFRRLGCVSPVDLLNDLRALGILLPRSTGISVSTLGYRTLLFAAGALGASSSSVFDELRALEPSLHKYELVREGMTSRFIKGLLTDPAFQRIYICSPWINLQRDDLGRLAVALSKAQDSLKRPPEILIITQHPKIEVLQQALATLKRLGAQVVEKPRIHSKLYMREPGPAGGLSLAIVGSENLTRQKWIELGIEIRNDSQIIAKLRDYFFQVFGRREGE